MEVVRQLVDAMIPGDGQFPAASAVGIHGILLHRLREIDGVTAYANLLRQIGDDAGEAALQRLTVQAPDYLARLRMIVFLAYYEQPAVIEAVRALGVTYRDAPQPQGYDLPPFDIEIDLPKISGHYLTTAELDQRRQQ